MKIITMSREYGAGGRTVGLELARLLGVELYDRDIVRELAKASGLDYDYLTDESETLHKSESFWRKITPMQYDQKDSLYEMQKEVVLELAAKGATVLLGRCADHILTEAGYDTFNVFLFASDDFRANNASDVLKGDHIKRQLKKIDAERADFYHRYTGKQWGDYKNYDLLLDTSVYGLEESAKIIYDAYMCSQKGK